MICNNTMWSLVNTPLCQWQVIYQMMVEYKEISMWPKELFIIIHPDVEYSVTGIKLYLFYLIKAKLEIIINITLPVSLYIVLL